MAVLAFAGQQNLVYVTDIQEAWWRRWENRVRATWEAKGLEESQRPSSLVATPRLESSLDECHFLVSYLASDLVCCCECNEGFTAEG